MTSQSIKYMGTIIPFDFRRSSDLNGGSVWTLFHTIPSEYHSLKNASTLLCTSTWVSFLVWTAVSSATKLEAVSRVQTMCSVWYINHLSYQFDLSVNSLG